MRLVVKYQQNPLRAARALSYVQVAMHDAWMLADEATQAELAGHRAASLVIDQLYPNETPGQFEAQFALLGAQIANSGAVARAAMELGASVGTALVDRSLRDGAGRVWPLKSRPAAFSGIWQPTFPLYAVNPTEGFAPLWRPWIPRDATRYDPPTAFRPGSAEHARETREVLDVARQLTAPQKEAALAWNLEAGSVTPGGVWMQLAMDELAADAAGGGSASPDLTVTVLAAVSVALHDAFVECWRVKLRDWSERPVTAIRRELDPSFSPLLVTPGFPSYVSGHSTVSAAAASVLGHFWPNHSARYDALAQEAAMSRLWGGIHFTSDNDEGLRVGRSVGSAIAARFQKT